MRPCCCANGRFRKALESGVAEQEFLILDARFSKGTNTTLRSCRPAEKASGLPENKRKWFPDWVEQVNRGREELVTALLGLGLFGV